jgi:hypothetical protein
VDADEVKEEPSEFNDDDYEYRSIIQLFRKKYRFGTNVTPGNNGRDNSCKIRRMPEAGLEPATFRL